MFKNIKLNYLKKRGFTLIELLIVLAIIGIISSVVIASVSTARMKSRDAIRKVDLANIHLALERFYDAHGYYPAAGCTAAGYIPGWDCNGYRYSYSSGSWDLLAADLAPYLKTLPKDPINSSCAPWGNNCYSYAYGNVGRDRYSAQYDLTAHLEDPNSPDRCAVKLWRFYFNSSILWCGSYSGQIYEASDN